MKETRTIMGMPVTIQIPNADKDASKAIEKAFDYFTYVDETFSTYKDDSEIMKLNRGEIKLDDASRDMQEIFRLAAETRAATSGYFDITNRDGKYDPSGIVKGWAINNAAKLIRDAGYENYYVEAGGDIEVGGVNETGVKWAIGIKNPFNESENVKIVHLSNEGIATSGTYIRGQHIYDPHDKKAEFNDIVSLTVIGPNVYEADRFATAAFAMGRLGIIFIEQLNSGTMEPSNNTSLQKSRTFEAYMIDNKGIATMTSGFERKTADALRGTSAGDS